ncbi:MAG: general secretion pathway protein GspB [Steroidobacter sp.]
MSFILDALKKSEREREQQSQGHQPDVIYRRSHTQPVWMIAVIVLLLANMALVTFLWLRGGHQQQGPLITVNNSVPATSTVSSAPVSSPANSEVRSLQNETQPQDETAKILADAPTPEGPQLVRQIHPDDAAKSGANAMINNYPKTSDSIVPTLDNIGGNAALNLPALHLDVHVYSINAAERFVFINMKKYTEGQVLKEGPTLEHITPEGAVLKQGEQQFLLPRQ